MQMRLFSLFLFLPIITLAECNTLFSCVVENNEETLEKILKSGANPNIFNDMGNTPLSIASFYGRRPLVALLIRHGADVNLKTKNSESPLISACSEVNSNETVRFLLQSGAETQHQNSRGETALFLAAKNGFLDVVKSLLQYRANPNIKNQSNSYALMEAIIHKKEDVALELINSQSILTDINNEQNFPLIYAAHYGLERATRALLEKNVPVNQIGYDNHTALYEAARMGHSHIVTQLLMKKADPNLNAKDNFSPLHVAAIAGHSEVILILLFNGARINEPNARKETALMLAISSDKTDVVRHLIDNNADVSLKNNLDFTAVILAANSKNEAILRYVLSKNPDINVQNNDGMTALHYAVSRKWLDGINLLATKNPNWNLENKYHSTPLIESINVDSQDIALRLIALGAGINFQNSQNETVLCYSTRNNKLKWVQFFLENNANINIQCENNSTATLLAAQNKSSLNILDLLLSKSPDLELRNQQQVTALIAATYASNKEAVEKLLKKNANPNVMDNRQKFPILIAVESDQELILNLLLSNRADPNFKGLDGNTVLHEIARSYSDKFIKYIDLILLKNADINTINNHGQTPLMLAVRGGRKNIFTRILINHANVNLGENQGPTPLTYAISRKNTDFVEELLKYGANPNQADNAGLFPLTAASQSDNEKIIELVIDSGATLTLSAKWIQDHGNSLEWKLDEDSIVPFPASDRDNRFRLALSATPELSNRNLQITVDNLFNSLSYSKEEASHLNSDETSSWVNIYKNDLFQSTDFKVNRNLYKASIKLQLGRKTFTASTNKSLHVFRSQVILFLPGVFGSEIYLNLPGEGKTLIYPNFYRPYSFSLLSCDQQGNPISEAAELDLVKQVNIPGPNGITNKVDVYTNILNRNDVINPIGFRKLYAFNKGDTASADKERFRVPYYELLAWPYDWRKKLESTVDNLINGHPQFTNQDSIIAPYARPPHIRYIIDQLKRQKNYSHFIDNKITLVGHSTGGLVIRGALKRPGIQSLVEKAFFIDVPFWGAPKAYYVYLTGDMGIDIIPKSEMIEIAPNVPIVYYLAPSYLYPSHVLANPPVRRSDYTVAAPFMQPFIQQAISLGKYNNHLPWNTNLDQAAHNFQTAIAGEPNIGWQNVYAFFSDSQKRNTPGALIVNEVGVNYSGITGDGTVPIESQKADFPDTQLIEIRNNSEHVPAPNQDQVWQNILELVGN